MNIKSFLYLLPLVLIFSSSRLLAQSPTLSREYIRVGGKVLAIESPGVGSSAFSLSLSSPALSVYGGSSVTNQATITYTSGFSGTVSLSISGLPSSLTASFSPASVTATGSSVLTLTASASASAGTHTLTVAATSGAQSQTATLSVTINAQNKGTIDLSASAPPNVPVGQPSSSTLTLTSTNWAGATNLVCTAPGGATCALAQSTVSVAAFSSVTTTVTLTSNTSSTTIFVVTATPQGANAPAAKAISIALNSAASLSMTTPTTPSPTGRGVAVTSTFSLTSFGYTGSILIGCSSPGLNLSCVANVTTVTAGVNPVQLTLTPGANVDLGNYLVTVFAVVPGTSLSAPVVTLTLRVVGCSGFINIDSVSLPLESAGNITLQLDCSPDPSPTVVFWQALNSSLQAIGNNGVITQHPSFAFRANYVAPVNSGSSLVTYNVRASDNTGQPGSQFRVATKAIQVYPGSSLTLYPQGPGPYLLNPGGTLEFGVQAFGTAAQHTCSVNPYPPQGTLTAITLPGYTAAYRYTAPAYVPGQTTIPLNISCASNNPPTRRDSFPVVITPSGSIPPSVTSLTWGGSGSTGYFHGVTIQGTHPSPPDKPSVVRLLVSASTDGFGVNQPNSCLAEVTGLSYGYNPAIEGIWRLRTDNVLAYSTDTDVYSYYLYPNYYNVWFYQNTQCKVTYDGGPFKSISYTGGNTITVGHGIQYKAPFVGEHRVWAQIALYSGLQSAWVPSGNLLQVQ